MQTAARAFNALQRVHGRTTLRGRLTAVYGGLFLISGAALLALTYLLVGHTFPLSIQTPVTTSGQRSSGAIPGQRPASPSNPAATQTLVAQLRATDLHHLLVDSSIALAVMAAASIALGWIVAGRVLRPLRVITATTHQITEDNLHQRLALTGPADELRNLGDTIDDLLARLDTAFDSQRRFVANASHELRTPVTVARTLLEMVLSDDTAITDTYRSVCHDVLDTQRQQEELIDALLTLARSQRGLHQSQPVDLAALVVDAVSSEQSAARDRDIDIQTTASSAQISGDAHLLKQLVTNLLDNAVRYNHPHGTVHAIIDNQGGRARLRISNTGPHVPPAELDRLLQPFQRNAPDRIGQGLGLGLSIVASIATAHKAQLTLDARMTGGLDITVTFAEPTSAGTQVSPQDTNDRNTTTDNATQRPLPAVR